MMAEQGHHMFVEQELHKQEGQGHHMILELGLRKQVGLGHHRILELGFHKLEVGLHNSEVQGHHKLVEEELHMLGEEVLHRSPGQVHCRLAKLEFHRLAEPGVHHKFPVGVQHTLEELEGFHKCLAVVPGSCRKSAQLLLGFHKSPVEELHMLVVQERNMWVAEVQSKQVQLGPGVNHRNPVGVAGRMALLELHKLAVQGHCMLEELLLNMWVVEHCRQGLEESHMNLEQQGLVEIHRSLVVEHCIELGQL